MHAAAPYLRQLVYPAPVLAVVGRTRVMEPVCQPYATVWYGHRDGTSWLVGSDELYEDHITFVFEEDWRLHPDHNDMFVAAIEGAEERFAYKVLEAPAASASPASAGSGDARGSVHARGTAAEVPRTGPGPAARPKPCGAPPPSTGTVLSLLGGSKSQYMAGLSVLSCSGLS